MGEGVVRDFSEAGYFCRPAPQARHLCSFRPDQAVNNRLARRTEEAGTLFVGRQEGGQKRVLVLYVCLVR